MHNSQSNESLAKFHRQLEALFLWYNLYYELTLAVTKLSRLLRCHACADWPKLRIRTLATLRDLKAKQADKSYIESSSTDEPDDETSEESEVETASKSVDDDIGYDSDIIPRVSFKIFSIATSISWIFRAVGRMNKWIICLV